MNYYLHILVMLEIYILLSLSAKQMVGLSGLLSLSIAVFYGIGAFSIAILETKLSFGFWFSMLISIFIASLSALIFSFIANKVRDLYFSLATIAIQIIFFSVIYNWVTLTNGPYGILGIQSPEIFGYKLSTPSDFAFLGGLIVIIVLAFYAWFLKTPFCRLIKATRDDQLAVLNFGKNPNNYKNVSIIISAVIACVAGCLYASYITYIDPTSFTLDESILILSIILVGGAGGILGPITGALIYILVPELLRFLSLPDSISANLRMILFGLLLLVIIRSKPSGIFGKYQIS
jgi:branched-chain amino acid transport system permease protein